LVVKTLELTRPLRSLAHALLAGLGARRTRRICRALRLANPAQTGRLAQSQTGCDARLRRTGHPTPLVVVQECSLYVRSLGTERDPVVSGKDNGSGMTSPAPSGAAEHRRGNRDKLAPCLSVSSAARSRVARAPVFPRSAGYPGLNRRFRPGQAIGCLSLGQARESTSPGKGETRIQITLGN